MILVVMALTAFSFWLLQGILYHRFWHRNLTVRLSFGQTHAAEKDTALLMEVITNNKFLPLPVFHVKFQLGKGLVFTAPGNFRITDKNYRSDIFSCMPWQEIRRTLEFRCTRRGYYSIREVELVGYDLFLSGPFTAAVPADAALYVCPGPADPVRLTIPFRSLMGQLVSRRALLRDPFEVQSVRPYQSFDPYSSINWKATAHTGSLKVNVCAPTASWQVQFLLDVDSDRIWQDEDLTEEAIRLCGSYGCRLLKEGIPVSVLSNGNDCLTGKPGFLEAGAGSGHTAALMELLARIQTTDLTPNQSHPSMEELIRKYAGAGPAAGRMAGPMTKPAAGFIAGSMAKPMTAGFPGNDRLYLLISPRQRNSLQTAFAALARQNPGCQWIVPLRPGELLHMPASADIEYYPWEVPYGQS